MRKLYEINSDIERCILEGTDFETGEFSAFDELNALQMERDAKLEGVALFVKDSRAEAAAIKGEIDTLKKRMDKLNRNADGAEAWLSINLAGEKFSTPKCECVFRKSEAVEVDEQFCDWAYQFEKDAFITITQKITPDKAEIKRWLKQGNTLEHCKLVERQNLTVK